VLAWLLESFSQAHIQNKIGFLISMLLAGYSPPSDSQKLVVLSVSQWVEISLAAREVRRTGETRVSSNLAEAMGEILERLGHLAPDQWPFVFPETTPAATQGQSREVPAWTGCKSEAGQVQTHLQGSDELQEARKLWSTSLQDLQSQMPQSIFDTWLRDSQVIAVSDDTLVVQVRSRYAVDWLENRLLETVLRPLSRLAGREMHVRFEDRE
jgi:hypothetical protein